MCVHSLRGALWLVIHDAAVGVQGERETAVKPLHGLIEGREPKSYRHPSFCPHGGTHPSAADDRTVAAKKLEGETRRRNLDSVKWKK